MLIGLTCYGTTTPTTRTIFVNKCSINPKHFPQSIPLKDQSSCSAVLSLHFLFSPSLREVLGQPREIPVNLLLNVNIVLKIFPALICSKLSNKIILHCLTSPLILLLLSLPFLILCLPTKDCQNVLLFCPSNLYFLFTTSSAEAEKFSVLIFNQTLISPQYLTFGLNRS